MRVSFIKYAVLFGSIFTKAQIGIGTEQPTISLEIMQSSNITTKFTDIDGIIIPTLTKQELALKESNNYQTSNSIGTLVYLDDVEATKTNQPSWSQVENIIEPGYYYFGKNGKWVAVKGDTTPDVWSNNPTNHYTELKSTSTGNTRVNTSSVVINDNGYFGINQTIPTKRLDINANPNGELVDGQPKKEFIKLSNLKEIESSLNSSTLVIDGDGYIYKNDVEHLVGQILRIPITGYTKGGSTQIARVDEGSIRLDFNKTKESPACVTSVCNKNFINTIKGVTDAHFKTETLTQGSGTVPRTTERITLPMGIYKIMVKLNGHYTTSTFIDNDSNNNNNSNIRTGTVIVKLAIDNNEYSLSNFQDSTFGENSFTSVTYLDYIELKKESIIDFSMTPWIRPFTIQPYTADSNGNHVANSVVLIERLR